MQCIRGIPTPVSEARRTSMFARVAGSPQHSILVDPYGLHLGDAQIDVKERDVVPSVPQIIEMRLVVPCSVSQAL